MKHLLLIISLSISELLILAQTGDFNIKETQKSLVKINDTLYASKYEVSNKQYMVFLNHLEQNNRKEKLSLAQIDSAKWANERTYNEPYVKYYHRHAAYTGYPVVNIGYEGAVLFCEWLTEQYNSSKKKKFQKVEFRLPTKEEWTIAAKGGNVSADYPWDGQDLQNKDGLYRCNFKRDNLQSNKGESGSLNEKTDVLAPVAAYWPNGFGLYNMSGNVAEMLVDKGQTKGGSWLDTAEYMKIDSEDKFTHAMPAIGFRYFMSVEEK